MTASESNELTGAIFKRVEQIAQDSGVVIKLTVGTSTLKLEFSDGQRILLNHDEQTHTIWLAAGSTGIEYGSDGQQWLSNKDGSELFARLTQMIGQVISSNRLNAQTGKPVVISAARAQPGAVVTPAQKESGRPLRTLLLLGIAGWLGYAAFQHFNRSAQSDGQNNGLLAANSNQCDSSFPLNGSTHIFSASHIQPDNPNNTEITVNNEHSFPFLAIFTAPRSVIPYLSVLVQARQSASIRLPAGEYDMLFSTGHTWCNLRTGFSDGKKIKLNTTLSVLLQQPVQLSAESSGTGESDFQIFLKSSVAETPPPATQITGDGSMEIRQHVDGHFHIAGSVNGFPVIFLVDTGASLTSLSQDAADRAGVTGCKPAHFQTANGTISGCVGRVAQLTIGNYQIQNATVAVMPNMEVNLLGMSVLNQFQVNQAGGMLRLARR